MYNVSFFFKANRGMISTFSINRSPEYKKVQQFVDSLLQPSQYMSKIENILTTIVKEQAPPGMSSGEGARDRDVDL